MSQIDNIALALNNYLTKKSKQNKILKQKNVNLKKNCQLIMVHIYLHWDHGRIAKDMNKLKLIKVNHLQGFWRVINILNDFVHN